MDYILYSFIQLSMLIVKKFCFFIVFALNKDNMDRETRTTFQNKKQKNILIMMKQESKIEPKKKIEFLNSSLNERKKKSKQTKPKPNTQILNDNDHIRLK